MLFSKLANSRVYRLLLTAVMVFLVTVVLLASVELALRFCVKSAPSYVGYDFYSNLFGDLSPNLDVQDNLIKGLPYHVSTSSEGFRFSPGIAQHPDKKNVVRVLCLGDSFTYGVGVDNESSLPALLSAFLKKKYPAMEFEVFNAGIPFFDIVDELDYWEEKGRKLSPDIVVCQFYYNDVQTMNGKSFRRSRRLPPQEFNAVYSFFHNLRIVQIASALNYKIVKNNAMEAAVQAKDDPWYAGRFCDSLSDRQKNIVNTTSEILDQRNIEEISCRWDAYLRNLLELRAGVAKSGADFLLITIPDRSQLLTDRTAPSTYLNARLAAEHVAFIDFLPLFRSVFHRYGTELYNYPYDFHTNKTGNTLMAHEMADAVAVAGGGRGVSVKERENIPYADVKRVALVYAGGTLVPIGAVQNTEFRIDDGSIQFQGAKTDRDHVEATVYDVRQGELGIDVMFKDKVNYFGLQLHGIVWDSANNGGFKGFASFDNGNAESIVDMSQNTMKDSAYFFEHYNHQDGFSKVSLRFVIGKGTGLIFDKQFKKEANAFVVMFE